METQPLGFSFNKEFKKLKKIGLFDSGVGGLTILGHLQKLAQKLGDDREFIYLGDTARCPFGNRPTAEIIQFTKQMIFWLEQKNVDAIVMACNTSAACAYYEAIDAASVPIIDLIRPTASYASSLTNKVAVLATKSTVASRAFSTAIHAINPSVEVLELACPEFVSIVECGDLDSPTARQIVSSYAEYLKKQNVQSVVLGCTHFPFLSKALRSCLPNDLPIIDPAEILIDFLTGSTSIGSKTVDTKCDTSKTQLYVTGSPKTFEQIAQTCLGYLPGSVKGISVEELVAQEKQSGEINAKKVIMETDSTSILLPTFNT